MYKSSCGASNKDVRKYICFIELICCDKLIETDANECITVEKSARRMTGKNTRTVVSQREKVLLAMYKVILFLTFFRLLYQQYKFVHFFHLLFLEFSKSDVITHHHTQF